MFLFLGGGRGRGRQKARGFRYGHRSPRAKKGKKSTNHNKLCGREEEEGGVFKEKGGGVEKRS